ncbi:MAG TPA: exodeoxyribonuclease VII small subunit [Microthrixaceae bacterium]|jgi:exodeoxyribonuclease VII small subunit|nr:exodeoxyribonuclease VII small subunit [Microthrixaceae bacterium]
MSEQRAIDATRPTPEELGFAGAMAELDQIVAELESDTLDVDLLAARVERAALLVEWCRERIDGARFRVEEILERIDPDTTDD